MDLQGNVILQIANLNEGKSKQGIYSGNVVVNAVGCNSPNRDLSIALDSNTSENDHGVFKARVPIAKSRNDEGLDWTKSTETDILWLKWEVKNFKKNDDGKRNDFGLDNADGFKKTNYFRRTEDLKRSNGDFKKNDDPKESYDSWNSWDHGMSWDPEFICKPVIMSNPELMSSPEIMSIGEMMMMMM